MIPYRWRTQDLRAFELPRSIGTKTVDGAYRRATAWQKSRLIHHNSDLVPVDVPTADGLKTGVAEILNGELVIKLKRRNARYARAVRYHDEEVFQSSTAALEIGGTFLEQLKNEVDVPWSGAESNRQ